MQRRRLLVAAVLVVGVLLPAVVTSITIAVFRGTPDAGKTASSSTAPDGTSSNSGSGAPIEVSGENLAFRDVALEALDVGEDDLPKVAECADALNWMTARGAAPAGISRARILITAKRQLQVTVDNVIVRVLAREPVSRKASASCSTTIRSDRIGGPMDGFQESFFLKTGDYDTPIAPLGDGDRIPIAFEAPLLDLRSSPIQLRQNEIIRLPVYVVHPGGRNRILFVIDLIIVTNGVARNVTVGSEQRPFVLYEAPNETGSQRYEWLEDQQSWTKNRVDVLSGNFIPQTRECLSLTENDVEASIGRLERVVVEGQNECYWDGPGGFIKLQREFYPTAAMAASALHDWTSVMTSTKLIGLGDEALIDGSNVIARKGATWIRIGLNSQEFNGGSDKTALERIARASFTSLL